MTACAAFLLAAAVGIGGELQLLWDDEIVDTARTTAARVTHRPENAGVVMTMDRPWENFVQYFNVFRDGDRYRLYYTGYADRAPEPNPHGIRAPYIYIACLESKDGIAWTRPELGLREFDGSKANNIILDKTDVRELDNCFVFRDDNPACPPDERYKAVVKRNVALKDGEACPPDARADRILEDGVKKPYLRELWLYLSADGYRFRKGRLIVRQGGCFDSLNTAYWDATRGEYRCFCRGIHRAESDKFGDWREIRDVRVTTSKDGIRWEPTQPIRFLPDADGAAKEVYSLYTNGIWPYFRNPKVWVGLPTRYVERRRWTPNYDRLPSPAARRERCERREHRLGIAITDCVFMMSRDGLNFLREDDAFITPGPEGTANWVYGDAYPSVGTVLTAGRDGSADVMTFYSKRGGREFPTVVDRLVLRQDGFVSRHGPYAGAKLVTKPFVFDGDTMFVNFATSARGQMFVTLRDEAGRELRSVELFGDQVDRPVDFEPGAALADFAGRTVVATFELSDADIYSFKFDKRRDRR